MKKKHQKKKKKSDGGNSPSREENSLSKLLGASVLSAIIGATVTALWGQVLPPPEKPTVVIIEQAPTGGKDPDPLRHPAKDFSIRGFGSGDEVLFDSYFRTDPKHLNDITWVQPRSSVNHRGPRSPKSKLTLIVEDSASSVQHVSLMEKQDFLGLVATGLGQQTDLLPEDFQKMIHGFNTIKITSPNSPILPIESEKKES